MPPATTATPALSDEDVLQFMELLEGADSVELKLTVPEPHQRSTVTVLELDPLEAQIRQVFFFDTPKLELDAKGVVVRARRIQGKGGDSIVKLRRSSGCNTHRASGARQAALRRAHGQRSRPAPRPPCRAVRSF
jgi:hypothetical protein